MIKAELPGLEVKDIELSVLNNLLTIRGEKRHEKDEEDENHHLGDRYYGSFHRTFQLPADIDPDGADATFDKGVLKINLPKLKEAKRKSIQIKGS